MLDPELLEILVCPETRVAVSLADEQTLARVNQAIEGGGVKNRGGDPVRTPLSAGLIREDRRVLYPIRDDIPIMLIDEAIELDEILK